MNKEKLKIMQSYPLELKIEMSKKAIKEFINIYGEDMIYIPYSGGKDSTVLAHLIYNELNIQPTLLNVNTLNEFKSVVDHVKYMKEIGFNVKIVTPKNNIEDVINKYGYPVISKQVSNTVYYARKNILEGKETLRVKQIMGKEIGSKFNKGKWKFLLDAPFKISDKCCNELKKKPFREYEKLTGKKPIIGTLAVESMTRESAYLKHGCNNFDKGICTPLGFWTENDILEYIFTKDIKIASVYGQIIKENNKYKLMGEQRTGCVACILGMEYDKERILRLKEIEPKKYDYVINRLGFKKVLDFLNYKY